MVLTVGGAFGVALDYMKGLNQGKRQVERQRMKDKIETGIINRNERKEEGRMREYAGI